MGRSCSVLPLSMGAPFAGSTAAVPFIDTESGFLKCLSLRSEPWVRASASPKQQGGVAQELAHGGDVRVRPGSQRRALTDRSWVRRLCVAADSRGARA